MRGRRDPPVERSLTRLGAEGRWCLRWGSVLHGWGESWRLGALLLRERRDPPVERSLPRPGAEGLRLQLWPEGPATAACPGSSCSCSCSAGIGADGGRPGSPRRAASEVPASSSPSKPAELLDKDRWEGRVLHRELVGLQLGSLEPAAVLLHSTGAQQPPGLLSALVHNDMDDAVDQMCCTFPKVRLQHLDQGLRNRATDAQGVQDSGLCTMCLPPAGPTYCLQLPTQPGQQGIDEMNFCL